MPNKNHYFIRRLFQNSKLNRENFVKIKKIYNENNVKQRQQNVNKIIIRKNHTYIKRPLTFANMIGCGFEGGNNGPNPPIQTGVLLILITASLGIYNHQKK
jgi:hypothetical protein